MPCNGRGLRQNCDARAWRVSLQGDVRAVVRVGYNRAGDVSRIATPIGELTLTASDTALTGVYFPSSRHGPPPVLSPSQSEAGPAGAILARARQQLAENLPRGR